MKVDFEGNPFELARSAAKFCRNPREAELEWGVIQARFEDEVRCLEPVQKQRRVLVRRKNTGWEVRSNLECFEH